MQKVSDYQIFNFLFPGVIFAYVMSFITSINLINLELPLSLFVYYFIGLCISRIGSIVVEPILKRSRYINFETYEKFAKASKKDPKINIFSQENNTYRTLIAMFFSILIMYLTGQFIKGSSIDIATVALTTSILLGFIVLFYISYIKQARYIVSRIKQLEGK